MVGMSVLEHAGDDLCILNSSIGGNSGQRVKGSRDVTSWDKKNEPL